MQHKTAFDLNSAAEVNRIVPARSNFKFQVNAVKQLPERQIGRPVDDEAKSTTIVVVAHIDHRALKVGIRHRWHGDEELMLQVHWAMDLRFARHEGGL